MEFRCRLGTPGGDIIEGIYASDSEARLRRELEEKGHYVIAEAIQEPATAVLVRNRKGAISNTDGPYMETKEFMAGFILVEARDMNEAVRLAAGIPMAAMGTIEVRPVYIIPTPPEQA